MRIPWAVLVAGLLAVGVRAFPQSEAPKDLSKAVRKAVEESTLDQPGTKPFHLKATIGPLPSSGDAGKTGTVEIWWESPGRWRREVHSEEFSQTEIVNSGRDWQRNLGDFFPEWLREASVAVVKPVPVLDHVLEKLKTAEVTMDQGRTHIRWGEIGSDGTVSKAIGAGLYLSADGSLEGGSGVGWSCYVERTKDGSFIDFHGRKVPRQIEADGIAKVTLLEDLKEVPEGFFDQPSGGDAAIHTVVTDELAVRKNLVTGSAPVWPPLAQGPLSGNMLAEVTIDRTGAVREVGTPVSDNPDLIDAFCDYVRGMRFKPALLNGQPVQVVTTITMPFKTVRPAGMESFDSARNYFENGRRASFLSAGAGKSYRMQAEFAMRGSSGAVEQGTYTDIWVSDVQWRRECVLGKSRYVRSRNAEKRYELLEGPDARVLKLIFGFVEPIPAIDTFVESDWSIRREALNGAAVIRVATGYVSPEGVPDAEHFRGYWFNVEGGLVKSYERGLEVRRSEFEEWGGVAVARQLDVLKDGKEALRIRVTKLEEAGVVDPSLFVLKGYEWKRQFTAEVR